MRGKPGRFIDANDKKLLGIAVGGTFFAVWLAGTLGLAIRVFQLAMG